MSLHPVDQQLLSYNSFISSIDLTTSNEITTIYHTTVNKLAQLSKALSSYKVSTYAQTFDILIMQSKAKEIAHLFFAIQTEVSRIEDLTIGLGTLTALCRVNPLPNSDNIYDKFLNDGLIDLNDDIIQKEPHSTCTYSYLTYAIENRAPEKLVLNMIQRMAALGIPFSELTFQEQSSNKLRQLPILAFALSEKVSETIIAAILQAMLRQNEEIPRIYTTENGYFSVIEYAISLEAPANIIIALIEYMIALNMSLAFDVKIKGPNEPVLPFLAYAMQYMTTSKLRLTKEEKGQRQTIRELVLDFLFNKMLVNQTPIPQQVNATQSLLEYALRSNVPNLLINRILEWMRQNRIQIPSVVVLKDSSLLFIEETISFSDFAQMYTSGDVLAKINAMLTTNNV